MEIGIFQLKEGARQARGLTVIIDVFRAFTVEPYLFKKNVKRIIPVEKVETAFALKEKIGNCILVGERNEDKIPGFDFGNSPSAIKDFDFTGKTVVHTTSSGTQGIINAVHADEIITGSFVNADAIVRYIKSKKVETVSLVCMGYACEYPIEEDTFCAEYIRDSLNGKKSNFEEMKKIIRNTSGARFFDPSKAHYSPPADFDLCMQLGIFDFVLKVKPWKDNQVELEKILC